MFLIAVFLIARWEDMALMDQNAPRNCLSLSTEMKPSGRCFSDEKHSVQSGRLVINGWEDMADMDQNASRNCLSPSTGMKPSGGCFRAPVLKDRRNFGRKGL